jgi:hypothetical protein
MGYVLSTNMFNPEFRGGADRRNQNAGICDGRRAVLLY